MQATDTATLERELSDLKTLYEIGRTLSATLDVDELLTRVVEAAVSITQAEEGLLLLPDADSGELTIRAAKNFDDHLVRSLRLPTDDGLAGQVLSTKAPVLVNNDQGWARIKTQYFVKSLVYVPLIAKQAAIGVLGVDNKEKSIVFTERDEELLSALASYAAIAIENAQLYENAILRAREQTLLVETAGAVSSSTELTEVLDTIARQSIMALDVSWCRISRWDAERRELAVLNEYRQAILQQPDGAAYDLKSYEQMQHLLNKGGHFTLALDSGDNTGADAERRLMARMGCNAMLAVPLEVRGQMIGLAASYKVGMGAAFTPDVVTPSQRVARRVIAPLFVRDKRNEEWHSDALEATEIFMRVTGGNWCAAYLWDREASLVRESVAYGGAVWPENGGRVVSVHPKSTYDMVLSQQAAQAIHAEERRLSRHDRTQLQEWGAQALLMVPLVFKDTTIGLLELADVRAGHRISRRELNLVRGLADQAAIFIENARLFGDLERSLAALQEAQSQLVRAARLSALGEMAAVVAHQLNNPLTTILADAEMLTQDLPEGQPGYESAAAIKRAGDRAKIVVERLLNIARPAEEMHWLDVNETIEATLELAGRTLESEQCALVVNLEPDLPQIEALPGQLEDVWLNLLTNARDAVREAGSGTVKVWSTLELEGGAVAVTIQDDGVGIQSGNMEHVFDPFFTTKPRGSGSGLGLYICRQIVNQHKGEIEVSSKPGKGTSVTVWLPTGDEDEVVESSINGKDSNS